MDSTPLGNSEHNRQRESDECLRQLSQVVTEVFWMSSPKRDVMHYVSPGYEQLFGRSCQSLYDHPESFLQSVHPRDRARIQALTLSTESRVDFEYRINRPDGSVRCVWDRVFPIFDDAGKKVVRIAGVSQDITERKLAEDAVLEKSAVAALAAKVATVLTAENSLAEILNSCLTSLVEQLDAVSAAIWTLNVNATLELQGCAGAKDEICPSIALGHTIIGEVARSREKFLSNDVQSHPACRNEAWMVHPDVVAVACYPLMVEERVIGVLGITMPRPISPFLLTSLGASADTIALGINRKLAEVASTRLEEQLNHSQKLEAVGKLAGGLAHDFNNMLTVINGCCQLLSDSLAPDDKLQQYLELIRKTGDRATSLTRQLLAFSRRQILEPKILDLNKVAANMDQMLRRLIPESITLSAKLSPALKVVKVDPGQIELVLMNLVVNSRDAMPNGGRILIETGNVTLSEDYCRSHPDVTPGEYVMLAVSDTGSGMEEGVRARIFEPFFTTKEQGKGTGLGLSTVYGIVKQSGGSVEVYSELGMGTTFKIYLPISYGEASSSSVQIPSVKTAAGRETILLVEDDQNVRELVHAMLESNGYTILVAANGTEAIEIFERENEAIQLLLSDIVMPKMGGHELAERLRAKNPEIKVLLTSGYSDSALNLESLPGLPIHFLEKPFTPIALVRKVREVLDGTSAHDGE